MKKGVVLLFLPPASREHRVKKEGPNVKKKKKRNYNLKRVVMTKGCKG